MSSGPRSLLPFSTRTSRGSTVALPRRTSTTTGTNSTLRSSGSQVRFCSPLASAIIEHFTVHDAFRPILQATNEEANIALIRVGLLGSTPVVPKLAFTLDLLEFYHRLRRRQATVGIQGFMKAICAHLSIKYMATLQDQFSRAFDAYFDLLQRLQARTDAVLGRDGDGWRLIYGCPCCGFQQANEPPLVPARLHAMDGCSSHKRLRGVGFSDTREFKSNYFLTPEQVDKFADEVKARPARSGKKAKAGDDPDEGLPISGNKTKCTENWRTENANNMGKGVTEVFDQTGVFLCACRHGVVEVVEEMIRSGELAKYAFAVIDEVIKKCGDDQCIGYDIGCSMDGTVQSSSLQHVARERRLTLLVNAFHGYAHNRLCQVQYHPLYASGLGIEDLETCERVFSSLGAAARLIRHASYFHWKQFIHMHLLQWDEDRYAELGNFLLKNYRQALKMIFEYQQEVDAFERLTGFSGADFERWRTEETSYLQTVGDETKEDVQEAGYVRALQKLDTSVAGSDGFNAKALRTEEVKAKEKARQSAARKVTFAMKVVDDYELRLDINERWLPTSPKYRRVIDYIKRKDFILAVDALEGLVIQRLFELAKANIAGTGYKLRKHISTAITRRSAAVRTALNAYNKLAPLQDPPRPVIDFKQIANYGWAGDFELLKDSRQEVLDKPWSKPANREAATKYFKVKRAREEIVRLNVEVARLHAWVDFEDRVLREKAQEVSRSDPLLGAHILEFRARRVRLNNAHRVRLQQIYRLKGYSGPVASGVTTDDEDGAEIGDLDEDEDLNDEMVRLGDVFHERLFVN
ncbi:hypothetical protein BV25DRAFT_1808428 [Artomyces pyxidatus]|uniref:Uncharacterized protein n=1 Tax=Artomyces pyxidatus TaxID=48021 RepID=A0ACB8SUC2_9AGAM|nr:hypothetical protein BV25DRAFT_1808428 [Artomyces pyxidatus]